MSRLNRLCQCLLCQVVGSGKLISLQGSCSNYRAVNIAISCIIVTHSHQCHAKPSWTIKQITIKIPFSHYIFKEESTALKASSLENSNDFLEKHLGRCFFHSNENACPVAVQLLWLSREQQSYYTVILIATIMSPFLAITAKPVFPLDKRTFEIMEFIISQRFHHVKKGWGAICMFHLKL